MASKTVTYKRASWLINDATADLQEHVRQAFHILPRVADRKIERPSGQVMKCLSYEPVVHGNGLLLHIVAETPGGPASIIHGAHDGAEHGAVATTAAPNGAEFMDGDIFAYILHNDICTCATNLRDVTLGTYLRGLFIKAKLHERSSQFEMQPVGMQINFS